MVKSAYSFATKKEKSENHIIVVWVDNEAGVLARVVGLFSGRGYNIDSLAVAEVDKKKNISRITIATSGTPHVLQQIRSQLGKLVPVHKVADFPINKKTLMREMALLKIVSSKKQLEKAKKLCQKYKYTLLDKTEKYFVFEVSYGARILMHNFLTCRICFFLYFYILSSYIKIHIKLSFFTS